MRLRILFTGHRFLVSIPLLAAILAGVLSIGAATPARSQTAGHPVLSEIYGGGGNSGATYTHDFIELYNPAPHPVAMNGWSVQYQGGSGSGAFTAIAKFSGTIPARGFFLIQANPGSGGTVALPAPDAVATFALAAASGKVALCADTLPVSGPGDSSVVDFAGYGSANLFEGSGPAIAPGNTTSVERKAGPGSDAASMSPGGADEAAGNGRDSDDNAQDFIRRDPDPQNSSSPPEAPGGGGEVSVAYGARWNLVSLPLLPGDPSSHALFPGALSPLYRYDGGYHPETAAAPGVGYWIRLAEAETVSFTGVAPAADTILLTPGWNLLGAGAAPVALSDLGGIPPGHLEGTAYGWEEAYVSSDTLHPGRGYWVRSTGGTVVFGGNPGLEGETEKAAGAVDFGNAVGAGITVIRPEGNPPPPPPDPRGDGVAGKGRAGDPPMAHPNPFNPSTTIRFTVEAPGEVTIELTDLAGRRIALLPAGYLGRGRHAVTWSGSRADGIPAAAGTYLYTVRTAGGVAGGKVLLIR